jgi:hypothetical protein
MLGLESWRHVAGILALVNGIVATASLRRLPVVDRRWARCAVCGAETLGPVLAAHVTGQPGVSTIAVKSNRPVRWSGRAMR